MLTCIGVRLDLLSLEDKSLLWLCLLLLFRLLSLFFLAILLLAGALIGRLSIFLIGSLSGGSSLNSFFCTMGIFLAIGGGRMSLIFFFLFTSLDSLESLSFFLSLSSFLFNGSLLFFNGSLLLFSLSGLTASFTLDALLLTALTELFQSLLSSALAFSLNLLLSALVELLFL